jgi:hypothetical protein
MSLHHGPVTGNESCLAMLVPHHPLRSVTIPFNPDPHTAMGGVAEFKMRCSVCTDRNRVSRGHQPPACHAWRARQRVQMCAEHMRSACRLSDRGSVAHLCKRSVPRAHAYHEPLRSLACCGPRHLCERSSLREGVHSVGDRAQCKKTCAARLCERPQSMHAPLCEGGQKRDVALCENACGARLCEGAHACHAAPRRTPL